jgi:hypothetical protein
VGREILCGNVVLGCDRNAGEDAVQDLKRSRVLKRILWTCDCGGLGS